MTAPSRITLEGGALARARGIVRLDDEAAVLRGYDRLKVDYGEEIAVEVWGEACRELDAEAEEDARVADERALLETLADVELVLDGIRGPWDHWTKPARGVRRANFTPEKYRRYQITGDPDGERIAALERLLDRRRNRR